jgi:predicted kinase
MAQQSMLHFICGKAGSGKTTLARELAARERGVLFCEDAWLARLGAPIASVQDYVAAAARVRGMMEPMIAQLLALGVPVVLDFAGNTPRERAWVRSLFERAGAAHTLHLLELDDEACWARIAQRNAERPDGLFFGEVSRALFDAVTRHFVPPGPEEGFQLERHPAQ